MRRQCDAEQSRRPNFRHGGHCRDDEAISLARLDERRDHRARPEKAA